MEVLQPPKTLHEKLWYIDLIALSVCMNCEVQPEDLKSNCRKREFVDARKIVCYLGVRYLKVAMHHIATKIGLPNHSCVIYHNRKCQDLMSSDKRFRATVEGIERELHLN